jgi:hypothetical protein
MKRAVERPTRPSETFGHGSCEPHLKQRALYPPSAHSLTNGATRPHLSGGINVTDVSSVSLQC